MPSLMARYHKISQTRSSESGPKLGDFTLDQDRRLLHLRDVQKLPWVQIREHLPDRSTSSLWSRYRKLKLRSELDTATRMLNPLTWTATQVETLNTLSAHGHDDSFIANALGRSVNALRSKRRALSANLKKQTRFGTDIASIDPLTSQYNRRRWTEEEIDSLFDLKSQGFAYDYIATRLGRTFSSVTLKFWKMEPTRPNKPLLKPADERMKEGDGD